MLITDIYGTWSITNLNSTIEVGELIEPSEEWYNKTYVVKMKADKTQIQADGVDTATITAILYKSTGETVSFYDESDNLIASAVESNSQASIEITSTMTGEITVKAVSENYGASTITIEAV